MFFVFFPVYYTSLISCISQSSTIYQINCLTANENIKNRSVLFKVYDGADGEARLFFDEGGSPMLPASPVFCSTLHPDDEELLVPPPKIVRQEPTMQKEAPDSANSPTFFTP
ncbi:uncharacterized protein LOC125037760 isoform X2 [Penaeus chinensis]|uniref:uncharacterized protein LOC125037760 isoform X2 n=1 Tax=Penaeus chinensis TaxID=139456 RepID=UPI001FB65B41|nr:uncharacterized protein LOC125037760 isoform X2 [Penaeus chinensis]